MGVVYLASGLGPQVRSAPETLTTSLGSVISIPWTDGQWLNPPAQTAYGHSGLQVTTSAHSDMWRTTSYGFIHDSGHGLLAPLREAEAMEVDLEADYSEQFDQAGMLVWASPTNWIKCGIEFVDGIAHLGAVVTRDNSDWSAHPVPGWESGVTTLRVSRTGDALTIRAKRAGHAWQLLRVAPIEPDLDWAAGPYAASPTRVGLEVGFIDWRRGEADSALHA